MILYIQPRDHLTCRANTITRTRTSVVERMRDTRCFSHSERLDAIERRAKARMKGGLNARSNGRAVIPDAKPPRTIEEAEALLAKVMAGLLRGEIEPRVASVVSKLCRDFIKAHKDGHLEREVQELKRTVGSLI